MKKVFVSSTVFDLLDVRAEVEHQLREMRLIPVLSGSPTSAFQPATDQNSIETCLINLRQSDFVIIILCQRYGPSLKSAGFDDVSATHLEYNEAIRFGKPIRMYVRDRLEADYAIYKKNRRIDTKLAWVRHESDHRLFNLLEEHRRLAKSKKGSNWFDTFRDSVELKSLLKRDFGPIAGRADLESLVMENRIPIISVGVDVEQASPGSSRALKIQVHLTNVGTTPAYRLSWKIEGMEAKQEDLQIPILAPSQQIHQSIIYGYDGGDWGHNMSVEYFMAQGHCVRDAHQVGFRTLAAKFIASGATCLSRTYHVASGEIRPFTIEDPAQ